MTESIACPCSVTVPHDPHFYTSAIVGGAPGPVPQVTCICPGLKADDPYRIDQHQWPM